MKKKTKNLILSIVVTLILLLTFTVTYAVFTYQQTGTNNQQLVLGDIYMHYKESNAGINIDNMMPLSISDYTNYYANPVMTNQTIEENELYKCVNYFQNEHNWTLDSSYGDTTFEDYCKGIGTEYGDTFQNDWNDWMSSSTNYYEYLIANNIMILDGDSYVVNPIMANQYLNELSSCVLTFSSYTFDEGSDAISFCQGSGTIEESTFQEKIDNNSFSDDEIKNYFDEGILISKIEGLQYFEFTISGKNTYTKQDIYYEIVLNHGDTPENRNTRIEDEFLKFRLVEVKEDESEFEIFTNKSYSSLENKRIHVETISKNTMAEINKTYRLYMWIDESVVIGNVDEDYTSEEWKDVFASIKVGVRGDLFEKELTYEEKYNVTDASCFTTEETTTYTHNANMTEEELNACITYITDLGFEKYQLEGETIEAFCDGTGTLEEKSFQDVLIYSELVESDDYFFSNEQIIYLKENNIIIETTGLAITNYDKSCGRDVVIPKIIDGNNVVKIDDQSFTAKNLTSVIIPDSVIGIGLGSFGMNQLTNVVIPDSVITIGVWAFSNNKLVNVKLSNSLTFIEFGAFMQNLLTNVVIPDSVISIGEDAFDTNYISEFTLGKNVSYIGEKAFSMADDYAGYGNKPTHVINKSGNEFDWQNIFDVGSTDGNSYFATGTFKYYDSYYGEKVVLITNE